MKLRRITIGWFVRQGDVRGKGKYLAWTEYSQKGNPIVWDHQMRLLFKRKRDAMMAIRRLHRSAARLVRHVRPVIYRSMAEVDAAYFPATQHKGDAK